MRLLVNSIESVGAVDAGDNPEAKMLFWKRLGKRTTAGSGDTERVGMSELTLSDLPLNEEQAEWLDAHIAAEVAKAAPEPEPEPVDVWKTLPEEALAEVEALRKRAADAEQALVEQTEASRLAEWTVKAAEFTDLIGDPAETGPVLAALAKAAPEHAGSLVGWLEALAGREDLAALFKQVGEPEGGTVEDRKAAFIKSHLADNPGVTREQAAAEFWRRNKDALEASREG